MIPRTILIRLEDFVEDKKRRERRRGAIAGALIALAIGVAVGASRPAKVENKTVTQTVTITETVAVPPVVTHNPPDAAVLPTAMNFLALTAGAVSPPQIATIRNKGDEPLTIRGVTLRGAGFQMTNGCGETLAGHTTCSAAVVFSPASGGEQTGSLAIDTNTSSINIPLRGTARPLPPVELAPLDFGRQPVDSKVPPQRVRFVNAGALAVAIGKVSLAPGEPFAIASNNCSGKVAPGGGCDVMIAFAPRNGAAEGELRIIGVTGNLAAHAAISGTGFIPPPPPPQEKPRLEISPHDIRFLPGHAAPQRVTISNPSAIPITVYSVRPAGGERTFRVDAKQCVNVTLQPRGGSCVIIVSALPGYRSADAMQLIVEHSGTSANPP